MGSNPIHVSNLQGSFVKDFAVLILTTETGSRQSFYIKNEREFANVLMDVVRAANDGTIIKSFSDVNKDP